MDSTMRNLASSLFLFLSRALAVMVQLHYVQLWFGSSLAGLNALLNQVTFYILIAELGLSAATISLLFQPVHDSDHDRTSALIQSLQRDVNRLCLIASPIIVLALSLYALHLHAQLSYTLVFTVLLLSAASSLITLLGLPYQAYLNAANRIFEPNSILGFGFLLKTAGGLVTARLLHSYMALVVWFPLVSVAEFLVLRLRYHRVFTHSAQGDVGRATIDIRARARFVLMHRLGGLIYYQSDFIILSFAASLTTLGVFAQYQYIAAGLIGLFTAGSSAITTTLARRQLNMQSAERQSLYLRTTLLLSFAGLCCALAFFGTARDLVAVLYTPAQIGHTTFLLFAILLLLNLLRPADDIWINARGAYHVGYTFPLFESATYIILGILLVRRYQMAGILMAGIVTNVIFSIAMRQIVLARLVFESTIWRVSKLRARALAQAVLLVVPLLVVFLAAAHWSPAHTIRFAALSGLVAAYMLPILWLFAARLRAAKVPA